MARINWLMVAAISSLIMSKQAEATLAIFSDEPSFMTAASITTTETFDSFPVNFGFTDSVVALDGVLYSTRDCTNRCWSFGKVLGAPPTAVFGSDAIATNALSFGSRRSVLDLGFDFISDGDGEWGVTVTETDGTRTFLTLSGQPDFGHGGTGFDYVGLISSVGIGNVILDAIPVDRAETNWGYGNVARSSIIGGEPLPDCTPVPPPAEGGPANANPGQTCVAGEFGPPFPSVPEPSTVALLATFLVCWSVTRFIR